MTVPSNGPDGREDAFGPDTTLTFSAVPADAVEAPERGPSTADLSTADLTAVEALPAGSALLVVQRGPNTGARFLLDAERTTAGRRPESDIFLDDVTVSRDHAMVVRRGDAHHLDDLGSLNGTYVNRRRIDSQQLSDGDELQVGKYKLVFVSR